MKHPSNSFEKSSIKKSTRPSIKWKIVFSLFLFTGIIILLLWLFQVVFLEDIYENIKYKQLDTTATSILKSTSNDNLEKRTKHFSSKYEICILIYDLSANEVLCNEDNLKNCWLHRYLLRETPDGEILINDELAIYYQNEANKAGGQAYVINQFKFQFPDAPAVPDDNDDKSVTMVLTTSDTNGHDIIIFLNISCDSVQS